jgi:hypothetical protein
MSEEDRIDEIIRSAASDYNRPPATPRDEMWAAIEAARSAPGPRLHVTAGGAPAGYRTERKFNTRYVAWFGMAAAAVLLIATGIGIGRWTNQAERQIAESPAPVPATTNDEIGPTQPPAMQDAPSAPVEKQQPEQPQPARTREEIKKNPTLRVIRPLPQAPNRFAVQPPQPANPGIYQVATSRHLADAEALLTSFTLGSRDASMNAQFADWAKGLLSNTRLLLDSPAGEDPRRARLLQDLELVLAQIVQLAPDAKAEERQLIEGSIQQGLVMTRLRTALPADQPIGTLERR